MKSTQELAMSIDRAFESMEAKRRHFQEVETHKHEEWKQRLAQLGMEFDTLRDIFKPRLDLLIEKFGDKITATPKLTQSTREFLFEFHSEVARIRMRFQGTTDHDIRKLILNYDLEIIPILMQFDSHSTLEMPLDAIDYDAKAAGHVVLGCGKPVLSGGILSNEMRNVACPLCEKTDVAAWHCAPSRCFLRCARCRLVFVPPDERPPFGRRSCRSIRPRTACAR